MICCEFESSYCARVCQFVVYIVCEHHACRICTEWPRTNNILQIIHCHQPFRLNIYSKVYAARSVCPLTWKVNTNKKDAQTRINRMGFFLYRCVINYNQHFTYTWQFKAGANNDDICRVSCECSSDTCSGHFLGVKWQSIRKGMRGDVDDDIDACFPSINGRPLDVRCRLTVQCAHISFVKELR